MQLPPARARREATPEQPVHLPATGHHREKYTSMSSHDNVQKRLLDEHAEALGPPSDLRMSLLDDRLPFMDRETLCREHGYTSCIKWLPCRSKTTVDANGNKFNGIKPDPNDWYGAFAEASLPFELQIGEGLPGRCMAQKDEVHHLPNLQKDKDDPRCAKAKELGVRGAFAVFRDGAVWEFVQESPMNEAPMELIETFGGSTGLDVASMTVLAAVRFKRKSLLSKAKKRDSTNATHDINGRKISSPRNSPSTSPAFRRGVSKSPSSMRSNSKGGSALKPSVVDMIVEEPSK